MLHVILYCRIAMPTRISDFMAQSVTSRAVDYKAPGSNLGRSHFCVETMSHLSFSTLQRQIAHTSLVQPLYFYSVHVPNARNLMALTWRFFSTRMYSVHVCVTVKKTQVHFGRPECHRTLTGVFVSLCKTKTQRLCQLKRWSACFNFKTRAL